MKTDIEIAQSCRMKHIRDVAELAGVDEDYLEYYGKYKAKIDLKLLSDRAGAPDGKLVLVTTLFSMLTLPVWSYLCLTL